ncbi:MAG: peptidylprolyl isomerase [Alphaproteobacteria bacterium]|nr:peptidylprolyl isomerase [Alphaproteobacteria bacterium]
MTARNAIFACLILALAATPALAQKTKPAGDPVVARVNGQTLTRMDVEIAYSALAPDVRQHVTLEQAYPQIIDRLVGMVVAAQAAEKARIDADPLIKRRLLLARDQILQDAYFNSIARKEITKEKLQAAYAQYAKDAPKQEEIKARHILVSSQKEAEDIIAQLKKGSDFAALAKDKTIDPSGKTSGGDLGWFTKDEMVPEFASAAFALKKGEFTQTPVHTQFGWHVIQVEDRRPAKALPYDQEAPRLAQDMATKVIGERVRELDQSAKVEIFALDGSKLPATGAGAGAGAAPKLKLPGTAAAPDAPTLAPDTAPDKLNSKPQ